jgi:hypothetical protein
LWKRGANVLLYIISELQDQSNGGHGIFKQAIRYENPAHVEKDQITLRNTDG